MKTYIINPTTGKAVTPEAWAKTENPQSAELLALQREDGKFYIFPKSHLKDDYEFSPAQEASAKFTSGEFKDFRCPSRKEAIDITDARWDGLNDAIRLVGGNLFQEYDWYWTNEIYRYSTHYAWVFSSDGYSNDCNFCYSSRVVPLTLCETLNFEEA